MYGKLTVDDARRTVERLQHIHDALAHFLVEAGTNISSQSPAQLDSVAFSGSDGFSILLSQSQLLQEVVADNAMALVKILTEPVQTLAPFSCARASLEAGSLCCWLLDDTIDAMERLARSLTLRLEGMKEQGKLAREAAKSETTARLYVARDRLQSLADAHGISACHNNKGEIIGYGSPMPSATDLVRREFGNASDFRICSAVVHGHLWAVTQLGFSITGAVTTTEHVQLEKGLRPEFAMYLVSVAVEALARTAWRWTLYCGFNHRKLHNLLDAGYDSLGLQGSGRFWKVATNG